MPIAAGRPLATSQLEDDAPRRSAPHRHPGPTARHSQHDRRLSRYPTLPGRCSPPHDTARPFAVVLDVGGLSARRTQKTDTNWVLANSGTPDGRYARRACATPDPPATYLPATPSAPARAKVRATHLLLKLSEIGIIQGITSVHVQEEACRNLAKKIPDALPEFEELVRRAITIDTSSKDLSTLAAAPQKLALSTASWRGIGP